MSRLIIGRLYESCNPLQMRRWSLSTLDYYATNFVSNKDVKPQPQLKTINEHFSIIKLLLLT
jgi:hypothetical protein